MKQKLYESSKQILLDELTKVHKAYWLWRSNFAVDSDNDFKGLTDIAFAIDNFLEEKEQQETDKKVKKFVLVIIYQATIDLADDKKEFNKFFTSKYCKQLCDAIGMTVEETLAYLCRLTDKQKDELFYNRGE